ncbi:MAG TPA: polyphenol oxidase family protein [Candidatus Acidoferrales bacterium]|nr:polyphenol oxidase family protein [Candidatus Acidoferrales bacterium]
MTWILERPSDLPPHWRTDAATGSELAFSTRRGGVSDAPFDTLNLGRSTADQAERVAENRRRFLLACGTAPERLATAGQVHGARIVEVAAPGHQPECDALLTSQPDLALAVTTADCMGILFAAPGAVAAAHAGWRGVAADLPALTLAAICRLAHCAPSEVSVHFGPCIRGCCYEVGDDVAARFPAAALRRGEPRSKLDLPTAARIALALAGLPAERVHDTGACTACEPHWYFSHRRDAGRTGRMWGVALRRGTHEAQKTEAPGRSDRRV